MAKKAIFSYIRYNLLNILLQEQSRKCKQTTISQDLPNNRTKSTTQIECCLKQLKKHNKSRSKTWVQEQMSASRTWPKLFEILLYRQLKDQLSKNKCKDPPNNYVACPDQPSCFWHRFVKCSDHKSEVTRGCAERTFAGP